MDLWAHIKQRIKRCTWKQEVACTGIIISTASACAALNLPDGEAAFVPCVSGSLVLVGSCGECFKKIFWDARRILQTVEETEKETPGNVLGHLLKNKKLIWSSAEDRLEICFKDCITRLDTEDLVDTEKMCLSNCGLRHIRAMVAMTRVEQKWTAKRMSEAADFEEIIALKKSKSSRFLPSNTGVTSVGGDFLNQLVNKLEISIVDICLEKGLQQAHYDSDISSCELPKLENCMAKFNEAAAVVDSGVFDLHPEDF